MIGLIENEIERDLTQRAAVSETPTDFERVAEERAEQRETAAVSDCESASEEVGEHPRNRKAPIFRTILMTRMPMRTKNLMMSRMNLRIRDVDGNVDKKTD